MLLLAIGVQAQDTTALDLFNRASREYLKVDKLTALRTLDRGLRQYPGDPRMLKLAEELLKEEQQQQEQEQQQKEQQEQDKQEEQEKNEQQQDKGQQKEPDRNEKGGEEKEQPRQEDQQQQGQQRKPGSIAPQDARRMLDALDRKEKEVQDKLRLKQRPATRVPIEKDW